MARVQAFDDAETHPKPLKENGIAAILKETKDSMSARKHRLSDTNSVKSTKSEPIAKRKEARKKKRQASSVVMQQRIAGLRKLYGMRQEHQNDSTRTESTFSTNRTRYPPNHSTSTALDLPTLQPSSHPTSKEVKHSKTPLPPIYSSSDKPRNVKVDGEEERNEENESGEMSDWEKEVDDLVDWSKGLELEDSGIT
eukprot:CAMPEP_0167771456 /NCGR_PEP_ID=MMETSP0111_2-20121227/289_1 /TAXON_ID=91324 /ORGANISM="Lotharella globosa, Strain CCCM811" /LENGTH=195 /DNA_ID=CAMNT_0007660813 /DNA_START=598 /DNA_END=1186 /DNA_ORIENTATION=+